LALVVVGSITVATGVIRSASNPGWLGMRPV
jgi:hypothetical protein